MSDDFASKLVKLKPLLEASSKAAFQKLVDAADRDTIDSLSRAFRNLLNNLDIHPRKPELIRIRQHQELVDLLASPSQTKLAKQLTLLQLGPRTARLLLAPVYRYANIPVGRGRLPQTAPAGGREQT